MTVVFAITSTARPASDVERQRLVYLVSQVEVLDAEAWEAYRSRTLTPPRP